MGQLELVSRWMAREGLSVDQLTSERFVEFARARRAEGYRSCSSSLSMRVPLGYLRGVGVVPAAAVTMAGGPVGEVLDGYRRFPAV